MDPGVPRIRTLADEAAAICAPIDGPLSTSAAITVDAADLPGFIDDDEESAVAPAHLRQSAPQRRPANTGAALRRFPSSVCRETRELLQSSGLMALAESAHDRAPLQWDDTACARVLESAGRIEVLRTFVSLQKRSAALAPNCPMVREVRPQSIAELCFLLERFAAPSQPQAGQAALGAPLGAEANVQVLGARMHHQQEDLRSEIRRVLLAELMPHLSEHERAQLLATLERLAQQVPDEQGRFRWAVDADGQIALLSPDSASPRLDTAQRTQVALALLSGGLLELCAETLEDIEGMALEELLPVEGGVGGCARLLAAVRVLSGVGVRAKSFEQLRDLLRQHWQYAVPQRIEPPAKDTPRRQRAALCGCIIS